MALYGADGRQIAAVTDVLADLNGVSLSPGGDMVAGYSAGGTAAIWQLPGLTLVTPLNVANGFTAGSLSHLDWLDNNTLALFDENGLFQVAQRSESSGSLAVTPLYGYTAGDRIARALRLANGRLLTAGYSGDGASSLRIWQIAPVPTLQAEGLPTAADPLCRRLQRALALPAGVTRPTVLAWRPGGELLTTGGAGEVAHWTIGGAAQVLPADEERPTIVVAPDDDRILRYGSGTDGQVWRLDASGWVQDGTLPGGEVADASWTGYGILAAFADGSAALVDPATGRRRPLPSAVAVSGSTLLTADQLIAQRPSAVELWQLGDAQPLAACLSLPVAVCGWGRRGKREHRERGAACLPRPRIWPAVCAACRRRRPYPHGGVALRRCPRGQRTGAFERDHAAPAAVNDGVVTLVDLAQGQVIWQSTGVGSVAGQSFRTALWSTDGQYLITQAQPLQQSSFNRNIGVWRWHPDQRRPILVQEVPSSGLLGVSPDTTALLAGDPSGPFADRPYFYPVLADTGQLQADVTGVLPARPPAGRRAPAGVLD